MSAASICQSMEHPSYNALTADITAMEDRERAYSLQYLCMNLGLVMSPTIAGILLRDYLWLAFLISGTSIGCSTVVIFFLVKDIAPVRDTGKKAVYQTERKGEGLWVVLKENPIIVLYIVLVSSYFATYQMYNYLMPLDLARLHGDSGAVIFGSITSVNCVAVVIFTPLFTRVFLRIPETVKTMLGQILLTAGFGLFMLCLGRIPFYYAAIIILTLGEVLCTLAESPYLTKRMPASHRGRINGVSEVLRTGITSIYQLVIGFVYKIGGSRTAWLTILAIGMFFMILCGVLVVKDRKVYKNLYL